MQICKGKTKTDAACRAPASAGGLCYFHANPNRAKTLGDKSEDEKIADRRVDLEVPDNMTGCRPVQGDRGGHAVVAALR